MTEQFKEYTIVRLDANNLHHLQALSLVVWGSTPTKELLYLKYYHPESEHAFLGYFAFDSDGTAVAFQGACRLEMVYKDKTAIVGQSTDTMTHPNHTGKGLFYYVGNKTYQLCKEKGMIAVMGYANQNSLPIVTQKFGFKVGDHLQAFRIDISTFPLERASLKIPFFKKIYQTYTNWIFANYKIPYQIPYSFSTEEFPILLREGTLIEYKQARGVFSLQIEQTILWVKISRGLFIGDMQCPNEAEWLRVMQILKRCCFGRALALFIFSRVGAPKKRPILKSIILRLSHCRFVI